MMKSEVYAEPVCPSLTQGNWSQPSLGTKARELPLILTGKLVLHLEETAPPLTEGKGETTLMA